MHETMPTSEQISGLHVPQPKTAWYFLIPTDNTIPMAALNNSKVFTLFPSPQKNTIQRPRDALQMIKKGFY